MMVPHAAPVVMPSSVLRQTGKSYPDLLSREASREISMRAPCHLHPPIGFQAQPINHHPLGFVVQTKKPSWWFWGPNHQTVAADFEAQTGKPSNTSFDAKLGETVITSFETKPGETVSVVLRPNHWQTTDLGFEAQPRNSRSSFPRARCRPHTPLADLPIVRPLSTRHVWPSPILCTRSPTPTMILIAACHVAPTTCTSQDKQTWFFTRWKDSRYIP
jgi:hypothetical protein